MLRIAICDDSQLWLQKIETLTRGYLKKINVKYRLDLYQSGEKLLKSITSPYDIALLDVDLHSTNGIEVASQLRATNPQIVLIFVSEYVEYAPFGYEVDAIRYACYEGKILTQCLCAVFSYVIMLALDTAAIFLFCNWVGMPREQIFADPQLYMICALFSYIVIFVVSFAIWRFAQSWTKIEKISVSGFLAMLVFPLVSLGTITFLFQVTAKDHSVSHWAIVNALGLVAANAVLMGLLHHIEQEAEERKQNVALQHQFETQLEKTQVLLEAQTAQRKQTHDFKHHLSVLGGLLQEENLAAARQYLAEISETGQLDALAVHSNNPVVDAILNQKYAQACELGIQVDFAINDLAEFPLSNKETVVVLSNLLDNAIEACKTQKGTRLIRVKIQCSEEKTILSVMNTIDKAPVMENGLPVTTKADPLAHGYGLQNIVSILADHGACPAILCQDGWFQFSTVLFHQTISPAPEHDQITQKSL